MTDALERLIEAVEDGRFEREDGPPRFTDFLRAMNEAGWPAGSLTRGAIECLKYGSQETADFMRAHLSEAENHPRQETSV